MKIAILVDDVRDAATRLERSFYWRGLNSVLDEHSLRVVCTSQFSSIADLGKQFEVLLATGTSLFDKNRPRYAIDDIRGLGSALIPLGLSLPDSMIGAEWDGDVQALFNVLTQQGTISVADTATQDVLKKKARRSACVLTGLPAIFPESEALLRFEPRYLFFAGGDDGEDSKSRATATVIRRLYKHFNQRQKTLFCALRDEDLTLGAIPGPSTLYQPLFSQLYGKAISSSAAVISFRLLPAIAAIAHRVPAVYVGRDAWSQNVAASLDLPVVELHSESDPLDLHHRIEERIKKFPWDRVQTALETLRRGSHQYLMERGIRISTAPLEKKKRVFAVPADQKPLHVCAVADGKYFPFAAGLLENLVASHGKSLVFHFLALDKRAEARAQEFSRNCEVHTYSLGDLWGADELPEILTRGNGFRAFSSKPRFLRHVLNKAKDFVLYADADVFFFDSPQDLAAEFRDASVLLFPHWNDDSVAARRDGLFNAGIVAVRPGAEMFLDWWARLCLERCEFDWQEGIVGDQGYLDFAPVQFEEVRVYRRGDHNVARWNLKTLGAGLAPEGGDVPLLYDGKPIRSFHAAFSDPRGLFEMKVGWDQLVHFFSEVNAKRETSHLFRQVIDQQKNHWLALARVIHANAQISEVLGLTDQYPSRRSLRFYVQGVGRHLFHLLLLATGRSLKVSEPTGADEDPLLTTWQSAQRQRLASGFPSAPQKRDTLNTAPLAVAHA